MSPGSVVYMAVILGLVWGGFGVCLVLLARSKDTEDEAEDETE